MPRWQLCRRNPAADLKHLLLWLQWWWQHSVPTAGILSGHTHTHTHTYTHSLFPISCFMCFLWKSSVFLPWCCVVPMVDETELSWSVSLPFRLWLVKAMKTLHRRTLFKPWESCSSPIRYVLLRCLFPAVELGRAMKVWIPNVTEGSDKFTLLPKNSLFQLVLPKT